MTPFRRQVSVISCKLSDPQIEVSTVDQFQGKDKLIGLVSFVKSFERREEDEMVRNLKLK
jgi:superfamily I DNA and/or RNA helicase